MRIACMHVSHTLLLSCLLFTASAYAVDASPRSPGQMMPKSIDITGLSALPNPANVSEEVTISGTISTAEHKDEVFASIDFGDGTFQSFSGDTLGDVKAIKHTYAAAGVYFVRLSASTPFFTANSTVFVVVGRGTVVNSINGLIVTATDSLGAPREAGGAGPRYAGGVTNLNIIPTRAGGSNATTDFTDVAGTTTVTGLKPSKTYAAKGIFVATTTALSGTTAVGKGRKMLIISGKDTGESSALGDPPSFDIVVKKMQGKFDFTKSKLDSVSFSGQVKLPAGFVAGVTPLAIGIGNVIDTVSVDEKGKATLPGDKGRITKLKVKFPKLAGASAGGEVVQIDATYSVKDLPTLGFDTEGITSALRSDEKKLKFASRQIQLDILLAGVPYETLAPVQFKLKTDKATGAGLAGQFKGIPNRTAR